MNDEEIELILSALRAGNRFSLWKKVTKKYDEGFFTKLEIAG